MIRLLYGGICNTDLELARGYYGFSGTPGHEFVGEVVEADTSAWIGERVVGEINLACEECDWCKRGLERHCPKRKVLGIVKHPGAFRDFLTLPERNLRRVPRGIPSEHAVFVEPLAAACEILDQVKIPTGAPVAVLGDGKLGLLIGQQLPMGYDAYNVPYQYRDQYADGPDAAYRYNDGYVYKTDPKTQLILAAIQLLS